MNHNNLNKEINREDKLISVITSLQLVFKSFEKISSYPKDGMYVLERILDDPIPLLDKLSELEELQKYKERFSDSQKKLGQALSGLGTKDQGSFAGGTFKHDQLCNEFRIFEDSLYELGSDIFKKTQRSPKSPSTSTDRKYEIAKIESELSHLIIMGNFQDIASSNSNLVKQFTDEAKKLLLQNKKTSDAHEIEVFLQNAITHAIKDASLIVTRQNINSRENFDTVLKSVQDYVKRDFTYSIVQSIEPHIKEIVKQGLELIENIIKADPPGNFWVESEGTPFDSNKHEDRAANQNPQTISFTVFPGYLVGRHVYIRASVFTN